MLKKSLLQINLRVSICSILVMMEELFDDFM